MKSTLLLASLIVFVIGTASAATIDFTSSTFSAANGAASLSAGGVSLAAGPSGAVMNWNSYDGLGIRYDYMDTQIEGPEWLKITFSTPVYISRVFITNLYNDPCNPPDSGYYLENGSYRLNGIGSWIPFSANADQYPGSTHGEKTLLLDSSILVNWITFMAPGVLPELNQNHEFSVAAITAAPVPIPAAAWLLGTGLVGLVALRRRNSA